MVAASGLETLTPPVNKSEHDRSIGELGVSATTDEDDDDRLLLMDLRVSWSDADDAADDATTSRLADDAVAATTAACTAAVVAAVSPWLN